MQRNRILNRISENGHLYQVDFKITEGVSKYMFERIGIKEASTFFGFCNYHDTELFRGIEVEDYKEKPEQNFLFAFRTFALEYHKKIRQLKVVCNLFKKHPDLLLDTVAIPLYRKAQLEVNHNENDYELFKKDYAKNNFPNIKTMFRQLDFEIMFSACSTFAIEFDLKGNLLNHSYGGLSDEKLPAIFVNIYPIEGATNILISYYLEDEYIFQNYLEQLKELSEKSLIKYVNYLIIKYAENIFYSPKLIRMLNNEEQETILKSFSPSINNLEKLDLIQEQKYYNLNLFEHTH